MRLFSRFRAVERPQDGSVLADGPLRVVPRLDRDGTIVDLEQLAARYGDPEYVYRTQPAVRAVVDFRVSRFIRVPLHGYVKRGEDDRADLPAGDALSETIARPRAGVTQAQFVAEVYQDWLLHDRWLVFVSQRDGGGYDLTRLPAYRWRPRFDSFGRVEAIRVDGRPDREIAPDQCMFDYGRGGGVSPMHTLQETLLELLEGARYRRQLWERGVRSKTIFERPIEAEREAPWSLAAQERFEAEVSAWQGEGPKAGTPLLLKEGIRHHGASDLFSPADTEYLEGVRLNGIFVASVYQTAPELLGWREGNFSNMDAFRQSLYRETLGGDFTRFEQKFQELVPLTTTVGGAYVEFLVEAALRGSFEEQARILQSATGAPWLLRSEARAMQNRPLVAGMDRPIVPLNVVDGGLASPRDTARGRDPLLSKSAESFISGDAIEADGNKAAGDEAVGVMRDRLAAALAGYFRVQRAEVLGAKADRPDLSQWDRERWDGELRNVVLGHGQAAASHAARHVLDRLAPDYDWSDEPMLPWLAAAARGTAERVNRQTHDALLEASLMAEWQPAMEGVFNTAEGDRALALGRSVITETAGFGSHEAARASGATTKTWRVTSSRPRPEHSARHGETVPLEATFSGGLRWPGDSRGSADDTAGCTCVVDYDTGPPKAAPASQNGHGAKDEAMARLEAAVAALAVGQKTLADALAHQPAPVTVNSPPVQVDVAAPDLSGLQVRTPKAVDIVRGEDGRARRYVPIFKSEEE